MNGNYDNLANSQYYWATPQNYHLRDWHIELATQTRNYNQALRAYQRAQTQEFTTGLNDPSMPFYGQF